MEIKSRKETENRWTITIQKAWTQKTVNPSGDLGKLKVHIKKKD